MSDRFYTINCLTAIKALSEILTEDDNQLSVFYGTLLQSERDELHKAARILMRQYTILEGGAICRKLMTQ